MEFSYNPAEMFSWENGARLISWLTGWFIFWRVNKNEFITERLYRMISLMAVGAIIGQVVAGLSGFPATLIVALLWTAIVVLEMKVAKNETWYILDNLVLPVLVILFVNQIIELTMDVNPVTVSSFAGLAFFALVLLPWAKRSYRVLTWYPSGKNGFIYLFFVCYWLTVSLLIAFWESHGLYWPRFIMLTGLVVAFSLWYRRSSRNWRNEIKSLTIRLNKK